MVSRTDLLKVLPPDADKWILVNPKQDVYDIIRLIVRSHKQFANYYDRIAPFFYRNGVKRTADEIYNFLKREIKYKEETMKAQTTALPTGILTRGFGDCKHYASIAGGILDAINRIYGKNIKWFYRFASYKILQRTPYHVFVVIEDGDTEIWIDPTPGANDGLPIWQYDKKVKANTDMALYQQIAGISTRDIYIYDDTYETMGWSLDTSYGYTKSGPTIVPKVGDSFFGSDFLGLSRYGEPTNTDLNVLLSQLKAAAAKGPEPTVLIDMPLLQKVLRENMQHWNFYYTGGTSHNPRPWERDLANFLQVVITPDGRLTFDRDAEPPHDAKEIHKVVDWLNYFVQHYSDKPYLVTMEHAKRLGKGWRTPQEGSAWHVIHTGDVNLAKFGDFADLIISKIPGLSTFLAKFGISTKSLTDFAKQYFGGSGGGTTVPVVQPPVTTPATGNNALLLLGAAGIGYFLLAGNGKKKLNGIDKNVYWIGGGLLVGLFLLSRKSQTVPTEQNPSQPSPEPVVQPPTSTPGIIPDVTNPSSTTDLYDYDTAPVKTNAQLLQECLDAARSDGKGTISEFAACARQYGS